MSRLYEHLTWEEVDAAAQRQAGIILPLGAIEQHGPHLPLMTDAYLAQKFALAGSLRHDFIVAPLMPYGYRSRPLTGGGPAFPATLSLSGAALVLVAKEILLGCIKQGFRKFIVYAFHMENQNFAYEAAHLAAEGVDGIKIIVVEEVFDSLTAETMDLLYGDDFPGWPAEHAGIMETSLMLYLSPEHVQMDLAVDDAAERRPPYDIIPPPPELTTRSGVLYRSTTATAEMGKVTFEEIAAHLTRICDAEFPELSIGNAN